MNESDLISAFHGAITINSDVFFGYVGLMSGFLVVSYLVADKLPKLLAFIVISLFTFVSLLMIFRLYLNGDAAAALLEYMKTNEALGNLDLRVFGNNPSWAGIVVPGLEILSTAGGYIGCVVFFFYRRKTQERDYN